MGVHYCVRTDWGIRVISSAIAREYRREADAHNHFIFEPIGMLRLNLPDVFLNSQLTLTYFWVNCGYSQGKTALLHEQRESQKAVEAAEIQNAVQLQEFQKKELQTILAHTYEKVQQMQQTEVSTSGSRPHY